MKENKEMEELLKKFTRGELKTEDLDQETAEKFLAYMKVKIREKLDNIRKISEETKKINEKTIKVKEETAQIQEETERIKKENEELAKRIQRAADIDAKNEEAIKRILNGEE
jgi:hypothetical protein